MNILSLSIFFDILHFGSEFGYLKKMISSQDSSQDSKVM